MADAPLTQMQLAYRAGVKRAFQYDTERSKAKDVVEIHEANDLDALRVASQPLRRYLYDCLRGQGSVMARSLEQAEVEARADCGRNDPPRNVRLATNREIAFRKAMGGD